MSLTPHGDQTSPDLAAMDEDAERQGESVLCLHVGDDSAQCLHRARLDCVHALLDEEMKEKLYKSHSAMGSIL